MEQFGNRVAIVQEQHDGSQGSCRRDDKSGHSLKIFWERNQGFPLAECEEQQMGKRCIKDDA